MRCTATMPGSSSPMLCSANMRARPMRFGLSRKASRAPEAPRSAAAFNTCASPLWSQARSAPAMHAGCRASSCRRSKRRRAPTAPLGRLQATRRAHRGRAASDRRSSSTHSGTRPQATCQARSEAFAQACAQPFSVAPISEGSAARTPRTLAAHLPSVAPRSPSPSRASSALSSALPHRANRTSGRGPRARHLRRPGRKQPQRSSDPPRTGSSQAPSAGAPARCRAASA